MTPEQRFIAKWVFIGLFFLGIFGAGYGVRDYIAKTQFLEAENKSLTSIVSLAADYQTKVEERDKKNQELNDQLHQQDLNHVQALNAAIATNSALRDDLDVAQRMQLKGTTCPKGPATAGESTPAGVDSGSPVEISAETRFAVFDLRRSIIEDNAAFEACKAYALK